MILIRMLARQRVNSEYNKAGRFSVWANYIYKVGYDFWEHCVESEKVRTLYAHVQCFMLCLLAVTPTERGNEATQPLGIGVIEYHWPLARQTQILLGTLLVSIGLPEAVIDREQQ